MTKILHIVVEEVVYKGLKNTDFGVRPSGFEFWHTICHVKKLFKWCKSEVETQSLPRLGISRRQLDMWLHHGDGVDQEGVPISGWDFVHDLL